MLDHVTIGVSDIERSKKFYDQSLLPLEITRLYGEGERFAGYGIRPKAFFWIGWRDNPQTGAHIAFAARDRGTVERFYEAAIKAGGRDNPAPRHSRALSSELLWRVRPRSRRPQH
jgi:catechol 2,3-dioxygenase-like lactoylglutathione lyase family enzyme